MSTPTTAETAMMATAMVHSRPVWLARTRMTATMPMTGACLLYTSPPRFAHILTLLGEPSKRLRARAMPCLEFTRSVNLEIRYFVL